MVECTTEHPKDGRRLEGPGRGLRNGPCMVEYSDVQELLLWSRTNPNETVVDVKCPIRVYPVGGSCPYGHCFLWSILPRGSSSVRSVLVVAKSVFGQRETGEVEVRVGSSIQVGRKGKRGPGSFQREKGQG